METLNLTCQLYSLVDVSDSVTDFLVSGKTKRVTLCVIYVVKAEVLKFLQAKALQIILA